MSWNLAIVIATFLGPIIAVQAQKWLERGRAVEDRRLVVFRTLMSHRAAMLSPSFVEALNAVPVDFYGKGNNLKEINDAWKLYLDHLDQNVQPSDAWSQKK